MSAQEFDRWAAFAKFDHMWVASKQLFFSPLLPLFLSPATCLRSDLSCLLSCMNQFEWWWVVHWANLIIELSWSIFMCCTVAGREQAAYSINDWWGLRLINWLIFMICSLLKSYSYSLVLLLLILTHQTGALADLNFNWYSITWLT